MHVIRMAMPSDAEGLLRLNTLFNGACAVTAESVAQSVSCGREIVVVAQAKGELVGFACGQVITSFCYARPVAELTEMYVLPAFRRKGIAKGLIGQIEAAAKARGADSIHLLTGKENASARAFYQVCGYVKDDEIYYVKEL